MTPSIGRIVIVTLSQQDADAINGRRKDASVNMSDHQRNRSGVMVHVGNQVEEGDQFPMIITRVWSGVMVNGQVMLDGNDTFWATSVTDGEGPHTWAWPVITKA